MGKVFGLILAVAAAGCGNRNGPTPVLDGVYSLRVESTCAALPADIRSRTYFATISGNTVTLSGGTFWMHPTRGLMNTFKIQTSGTDLIALVLNQPAGFDITGIIEETTKSLYFGIAGTGQGSVRRTSTGGVRIEGTFAAGFGFGTNLFDERFHTGCPSSHAATFQFTPSSASVPQPLVAVTPIKVTINGPSSVAPGQSAQFAAIAQMADGTAIDLTSQASWSSNDFPLRIDGPGAVTGLAIGDSNLTASLNIANTHPLSSTRDVVVVPAGTVRVLGQVTTGTPAQPVAGATVSVASGPSAGLNTLTEWDGRYALFGVAGQSVIRITMNGYEVQERLISGTDHQTLDVVLPSVPVPTISGTYTMTITADQTCEDPMPDSLRVRTYTASITQTGRVVAVLLSGVPFAILDGHGNGFPGQVDPLAATFLLDDNDHFGTGANPDVFEQLTPTTVLAVFGTITVEVTPNRLMGRLNGGLVQATRAPLSGFFWGNGCWSPNHQVVFAR